MSVSLKNVFALGVPNAFYVGANVTFKCPLNWELMTWGNNITYTVLCEDDGKFNGLTDVWPVCAPKTSESNATHFLLLYFRLTQSFQPAALQPRPRHVSIQRILRQFNLIMAHMETATHHSFVMHLGHRNLYAFEVNIIIYVFCSNN
jgi:hypothetical protein